MDLREWMLNQQRQFQEFNNSFGLPSHFGSFPSSFSEPFNDPFFSSFHNHHRQNPLSLQHHNTTTPTVNHRLINNTHAPTHHVTSPFTNNHRQDHADDFSSPRSRISFNDKFEVEINVDNFKPEVR